MAGEDDGTVTLVDESAARFRADAPNDFGLVEWGMMDVETWYSAWRKQPGGLVYPFQWDVRRVGRPYKRMTVVGASVQEAVFRAVYSAENASIQMQAHALAVNGEIEFMSEEESEKSGKGRNVPRSWTLWKHQFGGA